MEICENCGNGIKDRRDKWINKYKGEDKYYCSEKCSLEVKDKLENKNGLNVWIKHKGTNEKSKIFCDKIIYMHDKDESIFDHHLMFYLKGKLVFKIWLKNKSSDFAFNDIYEALDSVDIMVNF